jgi:hypothetical protein
MGLLEDAIREHLELKRLRGADPSEVAREQQELLDTPAGADREPAASDRAAHGTHEIDGTAPAPDEGTATADDPDGVAGGSGLAGVGEETAELDMEAVLAEQPSAAGEPSDPSERAGGSTAPAEPLEEDSLEWEVPARSHDAEASGPREDEDPERTEPTEQQRPSEGAGELENHHVRAEENAPGQGRLSF